MTVTKEDIYNEDYVRNVLVARGFEPTAYRKALLSESIELVEILHPINFLTEKEIEDTEFVILAIKSTKQKSK